MLSQKSVAKKFVLSSNSTGEKWELIILGSGMYSLEVNTISIVFFLKNWPMGITKPCDILYSIHAWSAVNSTLVQISPAQVLNHGTRGGHIMKPAHYSPCCTSLDFLQDVGMCLVDWVPHCWAIFHCWPRYCFVTFLFQWLVFGLYD